MDASELRHAFRGEILEADDAEYEQARAIFNSMIERRPAVIAQCESADDVAPALAFARENALEVAIRSGGHSVTGASLTEGGLVIDMRRMNAVSVDPAARRATVQGGAIWSDFDRDPAARADEHRRPRLDHGRRRTHPWAAAPAGWSAGSASPATASSR